MNSSITESSGMETLLVMDAPQEEYRVEEVTSPFHIPFPSDEYSTNPTDPTNPLDYNGNETELSTINSLSPKSDSTCYDDDIRSYSLGTPNSFFGDCQSPQDFQSNRSRLYSAGSQYTYSPYTPNECDEIGEWPLGDSVHTFSPPCFNRQTSLAIVEEVLGCSEDKQNEQIPDIPISSPSSHNSHLMILSPSTEEDSCLPPCPSPSFSAQFNAQANFCNYDQNVYSDEIKQYACIDATAIVQCDDSPNTAENSETTNTSECVASVLDTAVTSSANSAIVTCESDHQCRIAPRISYEGQGTLSRTVSDEGGNSLDVPAMLSDFLSVVECVIQTPSQIDSSPKLSNASGYEHSSKLGEDSQSPELTQNTSTDCPSTSKDCMPDQFHNRRERNNQACRLSRKRRKDKRNGMLNEVTRLTNENAELCDRILMLENECKKAKKDIFSAMKIEKN